MGIISIKVVIPLMKRKKIILIGSYTHHLERAIMQGYDVIFIQQKNKITPKDLKLAKEVYAIDFQNPDSLSELGSYFKKAHLIEGVFSFTENGLIPAAILAENLGVESNSLNTVHLLKNKLEMRKHLSEKGIAGVSCREGKQLEDVFSFANAHGYPLVVKPIEGTGSQGILLLKSNEEVFTNLPTWLYENGVPFLIEEFIDGPEFSVETFSINGQHQVIAITQKEVQENFVEIAHSVPAIINKEQKQLISNTVHAFLDTVGLHHGPSHTEVKWTRKGPRIIESHNRPGGDRITDLVCMVYGIDLIAWTLDPGGGNKFIRYPSTARGAAIRFLALPPGTVQSMNPPDILKHVPFVVKYQVNIKPGDRIGAVKKSSDRQGFVMTIGESSQTALEACDRAIQLLDICIK